MMTFSRTMAWMAALGAAGVLGGCTGYGHGMHGMHGMHAMHGMHGSGGGPGASCPMHADMQQKLAAAKTPEERQALMAEHHQGMGRPDGMQCPMMQPAAK